jgi:hypothetical protein
MSFTRKPPGKLLGGAAEAVNWGAFLIKQPEKQSAAPDMTPVLKNLRREILIGERWRMVVPPAYCFKKVSGGKPGLKRHTTAGASCR